MKTPNSLSDIQKYHYFCSCFGDEVLKIIQSLEFAAHNYKGAWGLLCKRYNRLLINYHLKSLFEIHSLAKASFYSGLRGLIDSVKKHFRATLKLPMEQWDMIIIFMILSKLDESTIHEWEQSRHDKSLPTPNIFFEFFKIEQIFWKHLELNNLQKYKDNYSIQFHNTRFKSCSLLMGESSNKN